MAEQGLLQGYARRDAAAISGTESGGGAGVQRGAGGGEGVCRVLAVHTGGLQGLAGVEERLGQRIFPGNG